MGRPDISSMEFDVDGYIANGLNTTLGQHEYRMKSRFITHKIRFPRYVDWKASKSKNRFDIIFNFPERVILNGNEQIMALLSENGFSKCYKASDFSNS